MSTRYQEVMKVCPFWPKEPHVHELRPTAQNPKQEWCSIAKEEVTGE